MATDTLAATLDAGMVDGSQLRRLNRLLGEIAHQTACLVRVPPEWLGAVAYACAWWGSHQAHEWLRWALSAHRFSTGRGSLVAGDRCAVTWGFVALSYRWSMYVGHGSSFGSG